MKKFNAALLALLLVLPNVSVLVRAQTAESEVLIKNGTVMTAVRGTLQNTDILIKNGKIAKIGKDLSAGSGAKVIDATGKFVTPGIIDIHSHLGDYPSPSVSAHSDGNEATGPVRPEVWAEHSVWPQDPGFSRALIICCMTRRCRSTSRSCVRAIPRVIR